MTNNSKNLIYYTVSGDRNYLNLLNISIESLITFGKYKGDILLICDQAIKDNVTIDYPNLKFMIVDEVDKNLSSGNKLRIYEYENLSYYDNILFLDSDILIINDINLVFKESELIKDKFIVSSEIGFFHHLKSITNNGHAGELLTEEQKLIYKDINSINAGCFLFRNNKENIETLKEIYEMYFNGKRLILYEQPYFNYVLLLKNKFIHNLQSYISHVSLIDSEKVIIHYCGGAGKFQPKFKFMKRDLEILKMGNNFISYDIDILNIWMEDNKFFIKSKIDIEDSKVVIYYNDVFVYKELVKFSKNVFIWFKPGRDLLEEDNICKVKVFDKYDNLVNSTDLIVNFSFKISYNKDEDIIYISCDRNLQADVFILRMDNSTIYKTESIFTGNQFWYKTSINLSSLYNIKIQIKKSNILLFEEVLSTNNINNSLCELMSKNGSDKGGKNNRHNYTKIYTELFKTLIYKNINLFELGLGTYYTDIKSNMGENGKPGASLRGWREFFKKSMIYGADIDKRVLFNEDRIKTFYCDQTNDRDIEKMWNNLELKDIQFDIIIDDGLHEYDANIIFFENSIHKLKLNGFYIIEDLIPDTVDKIKKNIKLFENKYPNLEFTLLNIYLENNTYDNNLLLIKKKIDNNSILNISRKFSMISNDRILSNISCVEYVIENNIDGDIVEIGVWKGGSILSMILTLEKLSSFNRNIHLYDTFSGMTEPSDVDINFKNIPANEFLKLRIDLENCKSTLDEVVNNILNNSSYPKDLIKYHVGDIVKTDFIPEKISILRLDTDWYESTKFELNNFYDKVTSGGIIIVDDYGFWKGSKKAVDEFLIDKPEIKIIPIDNEGIMFYKPYSKY